MYHALVRHRAGLRARSDRARGGTELFPRRALAILLGLLLVLGSLGTVRALDGVVQPGGAPDPKSGPFRPSGFVRVIDGESIEVLIDGRRTGIGILGVDAPDLGTPCGDAARAQLQSMVGRGVTLEDDPGNRMDLKGRRVYRVSAADGSSVAATLVGAGLARTTGLGPEASVLAAAEAKARQDQTGCVWGGKVPSASAAPSGRVVAQSAAQVPANFADETVASSLDFPTGFAFLPDGRVLVAEKAGLVKLITASGGVQNTVLDISSRVNNYWDRGLLGIAVDPDFTSNRRFYLFYVYSAPGTLLDAPKSSQLVRFTMDTNNVANPNAGVVLLGSQAGAGCPTTTADCLPAEYFSHAGGALQFAPDKSLFVSTGDASNFSEVDVRALRAQDVDSLAGKILHIDTDGKGISGNPYWNGNPNANRSKVWASGFRNPFRMNFRQTGPTTGTLFVGDVGWGAWEEIDVVPSGINAGWPCYEGTPVQDGYAGFPVCQALINQTDQSLRARPPLIEWQHVENVGGASLMGGFYTNAAGFPGGYLGALFYGDYSQGWIKSVRIKADNTLESGGGPNLFAQNILGPVQIEMGPDAALWYVASGSGELHRIRYSATYTPIACPDGQLRAEYFNNQDLVGTPTFSQCETTINHDWGYGSPDDSIPVDHFSARYTGRYTFGNDTYDFTTYSDDGVRVYVDGQAVIDDWAAGPVSTVNGSKPMVAGQHTVVVEYFEDAFPAILQASWQPRHPNTAPVPDISSPSIGTKFKVGDVVQLQGSAADQEQGSIGASGLRWDVILKHCPGFGPNCHDHPLVTVNGASGQFTVPDHGDGTSFEIRLTATDSFGLTGVTSRQISPKTLQVTLATNPSVGTITFDGLPHTPPWTTTAIAGSQHPIGVQPPAGQAFGSWSHGGAQSQTVTLGEQNVTYTANMATSCAPRPRVTVSSVPAGANARLVTVAATTNAGAPQNTLTSIAFTETRASTVEATGVPATAAPYTITYPNGTTHATFTARRSGAGAVLVSFTVTDACGAWKTFIGSGSTTGF
jgi:glucose/arabinose dehydrogenase